jgi:arylformamidase
MTAATALLHAGIICVGIDSPSIEAYQSDGSIHRLLLSHGITIIEFLDLSKVLEGTYWMVALPLRLQGLDGSPARVILMDINLNG